MKRTSQNRLTAIMTLSLLLLLAFAIGAQAAAAAHFSNGSAATLAAGTQGRGGASLAVVATTPSSGTAGRGGVDVSQLAAVSASTPAAGTAGRGGTAALPGASPGTTGTTVVASRPAGRVAFAFSRPRGALPVPQVGAVPRSVVAPGPMSSADWITLAVIAAFVAVIGVLLYATRRRRALQNESALASYCTSHPGDPLCGAA